MASEPGLERRFERFHAREMLPRARVAAASGALLVVLFALLDPWVLPGGFSPTVLGLRLGMQLLPLLLWWWATGKPALSRWLQPIGALSCLLFGLSIVGISAGARQAGAPVRYEGLLLVVVFFYCCGGLRLRPAALAGWGVTLCYLLAESWAGLAQANVLMRGVFLATANVIGMISCKTMELSTRRNYRMQRQLDQLANQDPLTGTLNRRALQKRFTVLWEQAIVAGQPLHVAMVDVDHFKRYNDRHGHLAGDVVLSRLAEALLHMRQSADDVVARCGGEEFVCLWYGLDTAAAEAACAALHARVRALAIAHGDSDASPWVSLSLGMVQVQPSPAIVPGSVFEQADQALYLAKRQGRNRSVVQPWQPAGQTP